MNKIKYFSACTLIVIFSLLCQTPASCQQTEMIVDSTYSSTTIGEFITEIQEKGVTGVYYSPGAFPINESLTILPGETVISVLSINLKSYGLFPVQDHNGNIFIASQQELFSEEMLPEESIQKKTGDNAVISTKATYAASVFTIGENTPYKNNTNTITGKVFKEDDMLPVIGGTVIVEETGDITTTDRDGIFILILPSGRYTLDIKSIECDPRRIGIQVLSSGEFSFSMPPKMVLLNEVVIRSDLYEKVRSTKMGIEKLSAKSVKEIPVVLGEKDIVKVAMLLPGVQSAGEGTSGFNVRGSPADQNLFYINNIPLYNTSHLFGFFSALNAEAISEFSLFKSNIPAQYGGRLASVFEVTSRQGHHDKFRLAAGLSPVSGMAIIEGPIHKTSASYLISARSTYSDWLLNRIKNPDLQMSDARFTDFMANITAPLNPNNALQVVGYTSNDQATLSGISEHQYANKGGSIHWLHRFNGIHKMELSLSSAGYSFNSKNQELDIASYQQDYKLQHHEARLLFTFTPFDNHKITYGFNTILYHIEKGDLEPLNETSQLKPKQFSPEQGLESGIFISEEWNINKKVAVEGGFRYNIFNVLGPGTVYEYEPYKSRQITTITDTLQFETSRIIKTYHSPDFRLGVKYQPLPDLSIKAGYNRLHQYLFLMSNTIAIAPTDMWKLCDYNIRPMSGDQYSIGVYSNLFQGNLEFSLEGYFKKANNIAEFKDGASLIMNEIPETGIIQGTLDSRGIEVMLKKTSGKLTGWVNYTFSKSEINGFDELTGDIINFGNPYPSNYDKPHAVNIVCNYKPNRRVSLSGNIVYSTGRPITYPTSVYYINGQQFVNYSGRNEYRLPDYFRADVSIKIEGNLLSKKLAHGTFIFSIYNLTGRKNAYSIYFKTVEGVINGYKLSIFGAPIPSLSYNFKLGNYAN